MAITYDPIMQTKKFKNLSILGKKKRQRESLKQLLAEGQGGHFCPPPPKKRIELSPQRKQGGREKATTHLILTLWCCV